MGHTLEPQQLVSHYRIVGPLGAGGMGEVYLAQDQTLERNVALKILPPSLVASEQRLRRFVLEAKSASSLNHPNIVTIHEIGQDQIRSADGAALAAVGAPPVHFIAMEFVNGDTFGDKIHRDKTDLRTLLGFLAQAADGLAKAHAAGIVHRDLKPGNIMVTKDGFAKVLDFGLAKLTERSGDSDDETGVAPRADLTGDGVVVGTTGYMSPEQVAGKAVDPRSDIFSFGCILYEAATRQRPFVGETGIETLHKIRNEKPRPVEELNPRVPADLRKVIRRCLAKSPDQRYQSIKDVAIELREIADQWETLPISGTSDSAGAGVTAVRPRGRRWMVVGAGAAVLVAAALLVWLTLLPRLRGGASGDGDVVESLTITSIISGNEFGSPALSPDGRYLGYVKWAGGRWSVLTRQIATGVDVQVVEPQSGMERDVPSGLAFSPDGDYLYYLRGDPDTPLVTSLFVVPSLGGTPRKLLSDVDQPVAFSPDGKRFAFWREQGPTDAGQLALFDPASGNEHLLATVKMPPNPTGRMTWSPDGRTIFDLLCRADWATGEAHMMAFDAETGKQRVLRTWPDMTPDMTGVAWVPGGSLIVAASDLRGIAPIQLWLLRTADGSRRRITTDESDYAYLTASADGKTVAAQRSSIPTTLWSMAASGAAEPRQIPIPVSNPYLSSVTEDGTVVYAAGERAALWAMNPDGSGRRQLTPDRLRAYGAARISGTHSLLVAAMDADRKRHVWRMDLDGTHLTQLTHGDGEWLFDVSRDGRQCLFMKLSGTTGELWRLRFDEGAGPEKVAEGAVDGSFSPDGKLVAYTRYEVSGGRYTQQLMVVVPSTGGAPVATLAVGGQMRTVKWSGDSSALAYVVDENGVDSLMRWSIPGGTATPLFRFPQGRILSHWWSRDGRTLRFLASVNQSTNVWIWSAGTTAPRQLTRFPAGDVWGCIWSPDAKTVYLTLGSTKRDIVLIRGVK